VAGLVNGLPSRGFSIGLKSEKVSRLSVTLWRRAGLQTRCGDLTVILLAVGWPQSSSDQYAEVRIELEPGRRQTLIKVDVTRQAIHTVEVWATGD